MITALTRRGSKLPRKYFEGLGWIAANDDCQWLNDDHPAISVSLCLLADLFNVDQEAAKQHLAIVVDRLAELHGKHAGADQLAQKIKAAP